MDSPDENPFPILLVILERWLWVLKRENFNFRGCVAVTYLWAEEKFKSSNTGAPQTLQPESKISKSSAIPSIPYSIPNPAIQVLSIQSIPSASTETIHKTPTIPASNQADHVQVRQKKRNETVDNAVTTNRISLYELSLSNLPLPSADALKARFSLGVSLGISDYGTAKPANSGFWMDMNNLKKTQLESHWIGLPEPKGRLGYANCAELNADCPMGAHNTCLRTLAMKPKVLSRLPAEKASLWLPYVTHHMHPPCENCRARQAIPPISYPDTRFLETTPISLQDIPTTVRQFFQTTTQCDSH